MRRNVINLIVLLIGLAIGGAAVWLFLGGRQAEVKKPEAEQKQERKIIYYRNPMDPTVTSPVPMKDQMGMDYVPVYEDEAAEKLPPGVIRISPEKLQKTGVKSEEVKRRDLRKLIRTVGRVEPVEDRVFVINSKVPGWVEKLYVSKTDQAVKKGQLLIELYSPELVSAQEEYLLALRGVERVKDSPYEDVRKGAKTLLDAAGKRLKYWDITDSQIKRLVETGKPARTMAISAPATGSVTEKMIVEGQRIEAGEPLFKLIDHSKVWVYGEVYEYEIPNIRLGQTAYLTSSYSPSEVYKGNIEHIYTHLGSIRYAPEEGSEARTAKIRFELGNPQHKLKLGMYLNIEIFSDIAYNAISIPESALIDTGTRQIAIIDRTDGTFEARIIRTGAKGEKYFEVKEGLSEGELVVTSANFLIDSESNLKAVVSSLSRTEETTAPEEKAPEEKPSTVHRH